MKKWLLFLLPLCVHAIEVQPWFSECLEFHFLGSYAYSRFDHVQNGTPQLTKPFNSHVVYLGLDFSPTPEWNIDTDIQFADTTQEKANFRSAALQGRCLWLDDIVGDPISFATGISARYTNSASLRDVSCPSHGMFDFELNAALGKEIDVTECLAFRLWGFGAVGHANVGSPWLRGIGTIETFINDFHRLAIFIIGSNGYGRHTRVFIDDFDGYAKIRQKSIDLGAYYGFRMGVWGSLHFEYQRRVLAKSCPAQVNTFVLSYLLPFCF